MTRSPVTASVTGCRCRRAAMVLAMGLCLIAGDGRAETPLVGPKRVVAVGKFDSVGAFSQQYGDWDIGGGLAAMLDTELSRSGQFIVVERAYVVQLMNEQQLKSSGVVKAETGPQSRQLIGAQFLIYGAVTEFGMQDRGGGFSVGGSRGGNNPLSGLLGTKSTQGAVAIDLRIVDTTSGQIVHTVTVKEDLSSTSVSISGGYQGMALGSEQFWSTPLGEATRRVINRAVAEIIATAVRQPWQGQVVQADNRQVIINAGRNAGVKPGDRFSIERVTEQLTDPKTGEVLSVRRARLGSVQVTSVEDKIASGPYVAIAPSAPQRGDLVLTGQ